MVTRIHKYAKRRLYLREHRKAKDVSAEAMGGRLGMERESILRMEREPDRCTMSKQIAWADAIGVEPEDLWWPPPGRPGLDQIIAGQPEDVQEMARDIVTRLVIGNQR